MAKTKSKSSKKATPKASAPAKSPLAQAIDTLRKFVSQFQTEVAADLRQRFHVLETLTASQLTDQVIAFSRNYGGEKEQIRFIQEFIATVRWNAISSLTQTNPHECQSVLNDSLKPLIASDEEIRKKAKDLKGQNQSQLLNALQIVTDASGDTAGSQDEFIASVKKLIA